MKKKKKSSILLIALAAVILSNASLTMGLTTESALMQQEEREWYPYGPCVDEFLLPVYLDYDAQLLAFKAGEVDWSNIQDARIEEVQDDPNIKLMSYPTYNLQALFINMHQYPWNYTAIRKAISHLIDKQKIVDDFYNGFGIPVDTAVPPLFGAFSNPDVPTYPLSPTAAEQVLVEAGFTHDTQAHKWYDPTGQELGPIIIQTATQAEAPWLYNEAHFVKDTAQQIDLPVEVEPLEFEALLVEIFGGTFKSFILYLGWARIPTLIYEAFRTGGGWNFWGLSDPRIDELCSDFYDTTDIAAAQQAAREIQAIIAEEYVPYIPIYSGIANVGVRSNVEGWILTEPVGVSIWAATLNVHFTGQPLGGTFRYPTYSDPATVNPFANIGAPGNLLVTRILEPLFSADPNDSSGDYPRLAQSWTAEAVEEDGENHTKITFNLVTNAYWHDGEKFDAYDVNCTWWFIKENEPAQGYGAAFENFLRTEIPDDNTIVAYLNGTSWAYIYDLNFNIVPEHIWGDKTFIEEQGGWESFDPSKVDHPAVEGLTCFVGTGPFVYTERVAGEFIRFVWNPNYWNRHPDKALSVVITAPEGLYEGDQLTVDVSVSDYLGTAVEDATVDVAILRDGDTTDSESASGGAGGEYSATFATSGLTGAYTISVTAETRVELLTFSRTVTTELSIRPLWERYLPYIGVAVIVVIGVAVFVILRGRKQV